MEKEKVNKQVQAYSLPPHQIAWLRRRAAIETTDIDSMSASRVLERILEDAIANTPSPVRVFQLSAEGAALPRPGEKARDEAIYAIQTLRKQHGEDIVSYLNTYWRAWLDGVDQGGKPRSIKRGEPLSKKELVWLTDWALNGRIPSAVEKKSDVQPVAA